MFSKERVSVAACLVLFFWAGYYLWNQRAELQPYIAVDMKSLAALIGVCFVNILCQGALLRTILLHQGINLRFVEWFGCMVVTLMWNYVLPFAGVGFRALYLKRAHGLNYSDFMANTSAIYVTEFLIFGIGGLFGIFFLFASRGHFATELLVIFSGISVVALALLLFSWRPTGISGNLAHKALVLLEAWYNVRRSPALVAKCVGWTLLIFLSYSAMYYCAFQAIRSPVPLVDTFIVSALSDFSLFLKISPASIGPFEASVVYSSTLYNLSIAQGLLAAGLIRIATIFVFLPLGPIFQHLLNRTSAQR